MKKISYLLVVLFASVSVFMSSCKDDVAEKPIITVTNGFTGSVAVGAKATFTILVSSNEDLKTFEVTASSVGGTGTALTGVTPADAIIGTTFKSSLHSATLKYEYVVPANVTKVTLTFKVTDKVESNTASAEVTVGASLLAVTNWAANAVLGAQSAAAGSSCVGENGQVYLSADAKTNQSKVDFIAYFSTTASKLTLYAPNSATVKTIIQGQGWTVFNATAFYTTTITAANFATATSNDIKAAVTGTSVDNVVLENDKVIVFVTAGGKTGLLKVSGVTHSATGGATLTGRVVSSTPAK